MSPFSQYINNQYIETLRSNGSAFAVRELLLRAATSHGYPLDLPLWHQIESIDINARIKNHIGYTCQTNGYRLIESKGLSLRNDIKILDKNLFNTKVNPGAENFIYKAVQAI